MTYDPRDYRDFDPIEDRPEMLDMATADEPTSTPDFLSGFREAVDRNTKEMVTECCAQIFELVEQRDATIAQQAEAIRLLRESVDLAIKSLLWSRELAPSKKAEQSIQADIKKLQAVTAATSQYKEPGHGE